MNARQYRVGRHNRSIVYTQTGEEPSDDDAMFCVFTGDLNLAASNAKHFALVLSMYERGVLIMAPTIARTAPTPPTPQD